MQTVYRVLHKLLNLPFCGERTDSGKDGSCTVGVTDDWFSVSHLFCVILSISGVAVVKSVELQQNQSKRN